MSCVQTQPAFAGMILEKFSDLSTLSTRVWRAEEDLPSPEAVVTGLREPLSMFAGNCTRALNGNNNTFSH